MMEKFEIIPAIDLIDGQCVRLFQGDYSKQSTYTKSPADMACRFFENGFKHIHVVDLDGAKAGRPVNLEAISAIARTGVTIELGGGIRTWEDILTVIQAGASYVILGTLLTKLEEATLRDWQQRSKGALIAGIDVRAGKIMTRGWQDSDRLEVTDLVARLENTGFTRVNFTDITTDGTLEGPNCVSLTSFANSTKMDVVTAGGVGSVEHIMQLKNLKLERLKGVILGRALYENAITLEDLQRC